MILPLLALAATLLADPITGRVQSAATGAPLAGALVTIGSTGQVITADSLGRFTLPADSLVVQVAAPGHTPETRLATAATAVFRLHPRPTAQTLEAVTVTASRTEVAPAAARSTLDRSELAERSHGQEVPLLLSTLPGVTATSDAGSGMGYTYFRLRGLDMTRVNMTMDGVPLNEPEDQGVYFSNFPGFLASMQSVDLQRGVGVGSSGTAAYAGSLSFESLSLAQTTRGGDLTLGLGSWGERRASVGLTSGVTPQGLAGYLRGSVQRADGYRRGSGNESGSLFASAAWLGSATVVKATGFTGRAWNEMAYLPSPESDLARDPRHNPLSPTETDRFAQTLATLSVTRQLGATTSLAATAYGVALRGDYDVRVPDGDSTAMLNFQLSSGWVGALASWQYADQGRSLALGVHANRYGRTHALAIRPHTAERLYENRGLRTEASAFARAALSLGALSVLGDVQLRRTDFTYEPSEGARAEGIAPAPVAWLFVNPRLGLRYTVTPALTAHLSAGATGREPTRSDLFGGADDLDAVNAADILPLTRVRPERARDVEAGATWSGARATVALNAFRMDFRDEITPTGQFSLTGLPLRQNVARSVRQGLEIEAALRPTDRLTLDATAALLDARIGEFHDAVRDTVYRDVPPLLTPRLVTNLRAALRLTPALDLAAGMRTVSRSHLDNSGDRALTVPAHALLDATLGVTRGALRVQLHAANLTARRAYSGGTTDGTERSLFVVPPRTVSLTARLGL